MKKLIAGLIAVLAILSFAGCGHSDDDSDCCKQTEIESNDCCESTEVASTYESDIPDCCGE